jgi:hypothetical protein
VHKHLTRKEKDCFGGGFLEHIFTHRVKLAHFARRELLEMAFM